MKGLLALFILGASAIFAGGCLTITGNCVGAAYSGNFESNEGNVGIGNGGGVISLDKSCKVTSTFNVLVIMYPVGRAKLTNAKGEEVGTALLAQSVDGVAVVVNMHGLAARKYAIHVHAVGKCDPPDFQSAGPHLNPTDKKEGLHVGDLPDFEVDANGKGDVVATMKGATLDDGPNGLFSPQGTTIVIQDKAKEDTTAAASAGARVACGVVTRGGR